MTQKFTKNILYIDTPFPLPHHSHVQNIA